MSDRLAEIEARLDKATPGPWEDASTDSGPFDYEVHTVADDSWSLVGLMPSPYDTRLIAHAPTDLRDLLAVVKAARRVRPLCDPCCEDGCTGDEDHHRTCPCDEECHNEHTGALMDLRAALANLEESR